MLERGFDHKDEYTSTKQSKQTKGDLLTKIQNKILPTRQISLEKTFYGGQSS